MTIHAKKKEAIMILVNWGGQHQVGKCHLPFPPTDPSTSEKIWLIRHSLSWNRFRQTITYYSLKNHAKGPTVTLMFGQLNSNTELDINLQRTSLCYTYTVEEEHGILTFYNGCIFSLSHFQFKSVYVSTILTSKLKKCVYIWRLLSWLWLGIYTYFLTGI